MLVSWIFPGFPGFLLSRGSQGWIGGVGVGGEGWNEWIFPVLHPWNLQPVWILEVADSRGIVGIQAGFPAWLTFPSAGMILELFCWKILIFPLFWHP